MTELGHGLLLVEEVADDPLNVAVIPDVLRSAPARNHDRGVVVRVDVFEREVGVPAIPGLLGIGVVARLEVMHHEVELLLAEGRDLDLVSLLLQPLIGIHHLQRLTRITGQDQNFWRRHNCPPELTADDATTT